MSRLLVRITKQAMLEEKYSVADEIVEEKIIEAIIPGNKKNVIQQIRTEDHSISSWGTADISVRRSSTNSSRQQEQKTEPDMLAREQVRQQLREGLLEEQYIEIQVTDAPEDESALDMGNEGMSIAIGNIFGDMAPKRMKNKKVKGKRRQKDPARRRGAESDRHGSGHR